MKEDVPVFSLVKDFLNACILDNRFILGFASGFVVVTFLVLVMFCVAHCLHRRTKSISVKTPKSASGGYRSDSSADDEGAGDAATRLARQRSHNSGSL